MQCKRSLRVVSSNNASATLFELLPVACPNLDRTENGKRQKCIRSCKLPLVVRRTYQQTSARQKVQERWSSLRRSANSKTRPRLWQQQLHWSTVNSAKVSTTQQPVQIPQTACNLHAWGSVQHAVALTTCCWQCSTFSGTAQALRSS